MPSNALRQRGFTLAVALSGAILFDWAGMPLPFLFGPMAFCLAAALGGGKMKDLGPWSAAARTILGVAIGASITPEVLSALPQTGLSVAFIPLFIVVIALVGMPFFRRVGRLDPVTAWYASMPGGLQDVIIFGIEAGANPRALSLIQATRVLIIVTVIPLVLTQFYGVSLTNPVGAPIADIPVRELIIMALAALIGWKGGQRLRLFGASILGPLIVTAALSLTGVIEHRPPAEAILVAQFFIGMGIGVHYVGVTWHELMRVVGLGVAFVLILAALSVIFAEAVTLLGLAHPVEALLSFAPGGQSEMTVLAIVVGADLGFVITHHMTRMILVITGAPIAARIFAKKHPE